MRIYIDGMKLPKGCFGCPVWNDENDCCNITGHYILDFDDLDLDLNINRFPSCPLMIDVSDERDR